MIRRRFLALFLIAGMVAACGGDPTGSGGALPGVYTANVFRVQPAGEQEIDVIAEGGSLTIVINFDGSTIGTLNIPETVVDGPFSASMEGTVSLSGSTVTFQQPAETFVRDLHWTLTIIGLSVDKQTVGGTTFTIEMLRMYEE